MKSTISFLIIAFILAAGAPLLAAGETEITFLHPPCGQTWLQSGLDTALLSKDYLRDVNSITAGTSIDPDPGRPASLGDLPGDRTAMNHWVLWFNDYLEGIRAYDCRACTSRIIVFHSCFEASSIPTDGSNAGNPFSSDKSLRNYKSVFRHPSGPGNTYTFNGFQYLALEDVMAAHPEVLFVVLTSPPLHDRDTETRDAARARQFSDWLSNDWQAAYRSRYPRLDNVAVFDWFDLLANAADSPYQPNVLKAAFGGDALGQSTLNTAAHNASTNQFASAPNNFLDNAWSRFSKDVLYFSQAGAGPGLSTELVLSNPSSGTDASSTIEFLGNDGSALQIAVSVIPPDRVSTRSAGSVTALIPAGGGLIVRTNPAADLVTGSVVVSSTSRVGGIVRFAIDGRGVAGVGAGEPIDGFAAPVRRKAGGVNTGIALTNTGGLPIDLQLQLLDLEGLPVAGGSAAILDVPPGGHLAQFVDELLPDADTSDFEGTIQVRAVGGKVAATILELGTAAGQFTTLPVIPLPEE